MSAKTPARIKLLESTFGNDKGDIVKVANENDTEIDYIDGLGRYCFVMKSEEGKAYRYIPAGERLKRSSK